VPFGAWNSHSVDALAAADLESAAAQISSENPACCATLLATPRSDLLPGMILSAEHAVLLLAIDEFCSSTPDAAIASPYNPLVLQGPPGVGKTSVARAVVQKMTRPRTGPEIQVVQLCGVEFAREYAAAVTERRVPAWRESVRSAGLLVLEDIGPLNDKIAAQSELIHTIDAIIDGGGQVLVTTRLPIASLPRFLPGLASRLSGGLCVSLRPPEVATREAILLNLAAGRGLRLQPTAARMLAEKLIVVAPELSGALNDLASLISQPAPGRALRSAASAQREFGRRTEIDVAIVRAYLKSRSNVADVTLSNVARRTARHYGVKVADLRGPSRRQSIVSARNLAMHLARLLTGESLSSIGAYFGGRDHTTVMHGCQRARDWIESDPQIRQAATQLRADLGA